MSLTESSFMPPSRSYAAFLFDMDGTLLDSSAVVERVWLTWARNHSVDTKALLAAMHGVRAAIPPTNPLATAEFTTLRERLIKIGARVIEHIAQIRIQLPASCPERALFRTVALGLMPSGP